MASPSITLTLDLPVAALATLTGASHEWLRAHQAELSDYFRGYFVDGDDLPPNEHAEMLKEMVSTIQAQDEEEEMGLCEYCKDPKPIPAVCLETWDKCRACPECMVGINRALCGLCVHCGGEEEEDEEGDNVCAKPCDGWREFVAWKAETTRV
jgi:hypothetical protein